MALKGDIVIAGAGQGHTRGQTSYLCRDMYINQSVVAVRSDPAQVDSIWLFYNLTDRYDEMRRLSDSHSSRGSLTTKLLKTLEIEYPSLDSQKWWRAKLYTLDRKIELNRQINLTLEQMAQALFKSWFVDFDPVIDNALDAGNEIPEELRERAERRKVVRESGEFEVLSDDVRALFPDAFVRSEELGWVPEGWDVKPLSDVTLQITDGTHSTVLDNPDGECFLLSCKNIKSGQIRFGDGDRRIDRSTLEKLRKRTKLSNRDVLVTTVGTIGEVAMVRTEDAPYEFQRSVAIIRADNENCRPEYLYQFIRSDHFRYEAEARSEGSAQKCLFLGAIKSVETLFPPIHLQNTFESILESQYQVVSSNHLEIDLLSRVRDVLLPRLISGEVEV